MNEFLPYTKHHLVYALMQIQQQVYLPICPLNITAWRTKEPVPYHLRQTGEKQELKIGDKWGNLFDAAWFHFTGKIPPEAVGNNIVLLLDVSGEMCVFDEQGNPVRGLTSAASEYDKRLGMPGKRVYPYVESAKGNEIVDIWVDAGCNDLFGRVQNNGTIQEASVAIFHPEIRELFYDFEVLLDSLKVIPEKSPRALEILNSLHEVTHIIWNGFDLTAVAQARQRLKEVVGRKGGDPSLMISAVGHAHIDLGWLWPIRETHRKAARTFSTALANMEIYPDYIFAASQAQLFQWVKDDHPDLYARVRQKIKERRLEPQGALWVECDTNVTGGESLIRQILYGKQFFRDEFNVDPDYVWLPDTFGYSAALPQLIKRSGMSYFSTQKLSWSLINTFPYQSFHWQGIDGSKILVHMLPEETYNSPAAPRSVGKIEENYFQNGLSKHALMVFGIGDGGGGPGEEHLERLQRIKNFAGLSPVEQRWTSEFFKDWSQEADKLPSWVGELYLERHQGTLTTSGASKWYNRWMEISLRYLEWIATFASLDGKYKYPNKKIQTIWKEVLLYQFHDILPGSSIKRVYDESLARYKILSDEVNILIQEIEKEIASGIDTHKFSEPILVLNPLSWMRDTWVQYNQKWIHLQVPAMGYTTIETNTEYEIPDGLTATKTVLENDKLRIQFGPEGSITSIFDKSTQREIVPADEPTNRLAVYRDQGDAWDIPMDYHSAPPNFMKWVNSSAWIDGPKAVIRQVYQYGFSELTQEISIFTNSSVIEFDSRLHWVEPGTMLRVQFPTTVFAENAAFEIQFGYVTRPTHTNTSWDLAKDEVPAQKWVDLAQRDYGVAILNDCKYGHRVKGHTIELNLLRSVLYPGTRVVPEEEYRPGEPFHAYTDQGDHHFRYALYPHTGDMTTGEVIKVAYEFNHPVHLVELDPKTGNQPVQKSLLAVDQPNIIIETVKNSENGDGIIIRLYEAWRMKTISILKVGFNIKSVTEVNLIEQDEQEVQSNDDSIHLEFEPFEIKTIRIRF